jgi:hypothetical protein
MTSVSRAQALLLSHPQVLGSYLKINNSDQLLPRVPKMAVVGDSLQCAAIDTLATAGFITSGGAADASATTYVDPARKFELRRIAAKVEVDGGIAQNVSMINDIFEQQIQAKQVAIWNTVGNQLIYGDNADPNPAGLVTFAAEHPSGVLVPAGGAGTPITLADLDTMIQHVRPWDGSQPRAFVMNRGQYAKVCQAARAMGFQLPCEPDPILGRRMVSFLGIPLLISDWITSTESGTTTSIYLVHMGTREGEPQLGGLVWFYNEDTGPGVRVDGPHRTSAAQDLLYADLDLNIGFATLSTSAVLRMQSIQP